MSNEARINAYLTVRKRSGAITLIDSKAPAPGAFTADVAGSKGPLPGSFQVDHFDGTDVDLSELNSLGGWCYIFNQGAIDGDASSEHAIEYGAWDPESLRFYPVGQLLPGEGVPMRIAENLGQEYGTGTGTGEVGAGTTRLRIRAMSTKNVNVYVGAHDA